MKVLLLTEGDYHWMVPITVCSSADPSKVIFSDILRTESAVFTLENVKSGDWIKVM